MIGQVMKELSRESFIYGTKIHLPQDYQTGLYKEAATEQAFTRKLDTALRSLQMDHVDILYHHMVSRRESGFYEPVMNAMEKAKRYVGSNPRILCTPDCFTGGVVVNISLKKG